MRLDVAEVEDALEAAAGIVDEVDLELAQTQLRQQAVALVHPLRSDERLLLQNLRLHARARNLGARVGDVTIGPARVGRAEKHEHAPLLRERAGGLVEPELFVGDVDARAHVLAELLATPAVILVDEALGVFGRRHVLPFDPLLRGHEVRLGRLVPLQGIVRGAQGRRDDQNRNCEQQVFEGHVNLACEKRLTSPRRIHWSAHTPSNGAGCRRARSCRGPAARASSGRQGTSPGRRRCQSGTCSDRSV